MKCLRIAAVALTIPFAAPLTWRRGIRTTPTWAAADGRSR
jgi:hypothetical protein